MKRIIWHWSAGTHKASAIDREHYHLLIEGDGRAVYGDKPIRANAAPLSANYAAHTRSLNTDSIGIALCAMWGARQVPFDPGKYPITEAQVRSLVKETARLAEGYNIPVTRQTILSHAEVQPTLGVKQSGKWDIAWLPGRATSTDPIGCGDYLRKLVSEHMAGVVRPVPKSVDVPQSPPRNTQTSLSVPKQPQGGIIGAIISFIAKLFGGGK